MNDAVAMSTAGTANREHPLPYDRLARLGLHTWWMPPVSTLVVVFGAMLMVCGAMAVTGVVNLLGGREFNQQPTPFEDTVQSLIWVALLIPVVLIVAKLVQRRPARTLHSVTGRIRWRWLAICTVLGLVATTALVLVLTAIYGSEAEPTLTIGWERYLPIAALLLVLVPFQAAGEEYLCRGYLLQSYASYQRWIGVILSSVGFAALHGFSGWPGFLGLTASGAIWALLVIRTGGLEVSIAAHAVNNVISLQLAAAAGGLDIPLETSAADATLTDAAVASGVDVMYALMVLGLLRLLTRYRPAWVPAGVTARVAGP